MQIFVKDKSCRTYPLRVQERDTVASVNRRIRDNTGIPVDQQLLFQRQESVGHRYLLDQETLSHYNIMDGDTLSFRVALSTEDAGMELQVTMEDMHVTVNLIGLKPTDTIERLKNKIQDKTGTPKSIQQLKFKNELLQDHMRIMDYNIRRADVVIMVGGFGTCLVEN